MNEFPIIFTFGMPPEGGPGLVFKTLPVLFNQMPGTLVVSTVFFVLLVFTALTSTISLMEVVVANLMELLSWSRAKSVLLASSAIFIFAIPSALSGSGALFPTWKNLYGKDFFGSLDYVTGSWMLPLAALFTTLFIGWFMDKRISADEFVRGTTLGKLLRVWFFLVRWLAPVAILLVMLQESGIVDINMIIDYCQFGCEK